MHWSYLKKLSFKNTLCDNSLVVKKVEENN